MCRLRRAIILALVFFSSASLFSQETPRAISESYPNTANGLNLFLEELLLATRNGDEERVRALIQQTEIPNYREWFNRMYLADSAEGWARLYGKHLTADQESLRQLFVNFAHLQGFFFVRKVNDIQSSDTGLEWAMLHSAKEPLDVYLASWKPGSSGNASSQAFAYFIYIDGMFRWDTSIHFANLRTVEPAPEKAAPEPITETEAPLSGPPFKVGGAVTAPKAITMVDPEYTEQARKANLEGTILLSFIVDIDGRPKNIAVTRPLGAGLEQQAITAVRQWRFQPATKDGKPVPVEVTAEVSFHLYRK